MSIKCMLEGQSKGGIESFNGRKGAVVPQTGDYTAEQVGALPVDGTAIKANETTKLSTPRSIQTNLASNGTASFNGTADITPGVTGILSIANGGTGAGTAEGALANLGIASADEVAPYAKQLKTPRKLSLTGSITSPGIVIEGKGSTKIMTTTLADSNVTAGTYGPFLNGICWMANNRGIKSTTATWTLTAKKAGTFRFLYAGSAEENYDYLVVTIKGTEALNTKGVASPYGGYHEVALAIGDVIVFKYIEDSSNFYEGDYAGIGNMSLDGNTITPNNIDTYFTVTDGEYTFEPMLAFTGGFLSVNENGRIVSAKNVYVTSYTLDDWATTTSTVYNWGDETAVGDAAWWAGLKNWVIKATPEERQACVGKKKKVSLSTAVLGANAASMVCIGADQDGDKTLTFQTEGVLPIETEFCNDYTVPQSITTRAPDPTSGNPLWNGSKAQSFCNDFGNQCSASASLKSITKLTSSACNNNRDNPADVETTAKCWLPSEQEMGLDEYSPSRLECTKGTTNIGYSYYNSNTKRIKYQMNADGNLSTTAYTYWERSRAYDGNWCVCYVISNGVSGRWGPASIYSLAPAFVIG